MLLKTLRNKSQFLLCGDSNQIVHPNFFSWAKVNSYFYQHGNISQDITRILTKNYRNANQVTELANRLLKLKNVRFSSIDKLSNYLVESSSNNQGVIQLLPDNHKVLKVFNDKTKLSTKVAVLVLDEQQKNLAKQRFQTPLIFTIQEAKGLEYNSVILFNFISSKPDIYHEITRGVHKDDLKGPLTYSRSKDKTDKSLEIYKFYINALYVAVTRAIQNTYVIEE